MPSTASLQELMAASAMMITLEKIASSGCLPLDEEINVRQLIVRAGNAFGIDSLAERTSAEVINFEAQVDAVREQMAAPTFNHSR